jgi:aminopeptidase-like protein
MDPKFESILITGGTDSFEIYKKCIEALEGNCVYKAANTCGPQIGKRGLYPLLSRKGSCDGVRAMRDFLAYADGTNDLLEIGDIIGVPAEELRVTAECAEECGLVHKV